MFNTTKKEDALILEIANRAAKELGYEDIQGTQMDLEAVHTHDCPLNFRKLLGFDSAEFAHDVGGINRHLNRGTLKLEDLFVPRCCLPSRQTDPTALEAMQSLDQTVEGLRADEALLRDQIAEYTLLISQLDATGVWTPAEQVELVEFKPYFVRRPQTPDCVMVAKWTLLGWDTQQGEPGAPPELEVLVS